MSQNDLETEHRSVVRRLLDLGFVRVQPVYEGEERDLVHRHGAIARLLRMFRKSSDSG